MHVYEAITSRRSVRRFLNTPVPRETVRHILDTASRAPSGHNIQPWRVYALAGAARDRLCHDILQAASTDAQAHQPEYEYYPADWHEPYTSRRRKIGYDLYATLGIAPGHDDPAAPENALITLREPAAAFTTFVGFDE